jgi:hypothetical protein
MVKAMGGRVSKTVQRRRERVLAVLNSAAAP